MQDIIRQSNSSVYGVKKRSRSRDKWQVHIKRTKECRFHSRTGINTQKDKIKYMFI